MALHGTLPGMRTLLMALLIGIAAVETVVVLVLAVGLFMLGSSLSITVGAVMLLVSLTAVGLVLRFVRKGRTRA